MQSQQPAAPPVRPPVFLGCAGALLGVLVLVGLAVFMVGFLESGADTGKRTLDPAESYAPGTVSYAPAQGLYVVRTPDRNFLALSDVDAANRASPTKCRAAQVALDDPILPQLIQDYGSRMSPEASGSTLLLRESCHRAVYDFTGLRLDADGPNLDRYAVSIDTAGKLTVDVTKRTCSERSGSQPFAPVSCPK